MREISRVSVRAVPNAKKTGFAGMAGSVFRIRISAPPDDNRANRELLRFLSDRTGIKEKNIRIIKGLKSKDKTVEFEGPGASAAAGMISG